MTVDTNIDTNSGTNANIARPGFRTWLWERSPIEQRATAVLLAKLITIGALAVAPTWPEVARAIEAAGITLEPGPRPGAVVARAHDLWLDWLCDTIEVLPVTSADPRVRAARYDFASEDSFICTCCDIPLLLDGPGVCDSEEHWEPGAGDCQRVVLGGVGTPSGVCWRCERFSDEQAERMHAARLRRLLPAPPLPADDIAVHRRADLVAHRGQESRLRLVGRLCRIARSFGVQTRRFRDVLLPLQRFLCVLLLRHGLD